MDFQERSTVESTTHAYFSDNLVAFVSSTRRFASKGTRTSESPQLSSAISANTNQTEDKTEAALSLVKWIRTQIFFQITLEEVIYFNSITANYDFAQATRIASIKETR